MNSPEQSGISYDLLVSPAYRWLRHLFFVLIALFAALNQTFFVFDPVGSGVLFYIPIVYTCLIYIVAGYINLYHLIPYSLLIKKPIRYILLFLFLLIGVILLQIVLEYLMIEYVGLQAGKSSYFFDDQSFYMMFFSDIIVMAFSLLGISITVILKHWFLENKQLNQLETLRGKIEVEKLKEQVSPDFLFRILHRMGELALTDPGRTSGMLMYLSRLLRYQLYEGNRDQVLLTGEIQFLTNYLLLEQSYTGTFTFEVVTEKEIQYLFLPPLLFLPIVQYTVNRWREREHTQPFKIEFRYEEEYLHFYCSRSSAGNTVYPEVLFKRFRILFGDQFGERVEDNECQTEYIHLIIPGS